MKILAAIGLAAGLVATLAATPAMSMGWLANRPGLGGCTPRMERAGKCVKAPEIDAASGVQAIALLTGVVLLIGARARRRRG